MFEIGGASGPFDPFYRRISTKMSSYSNLKNWKQNKIEKYTFERRNSKNRESRVLYGFVRYF